MANVVIIVGLSIDVKNMIKLDFLCGSRSKRSLKRFYEYYALTIMSLSECHTCFITLLVREIRKARVYQLNSS